MDEVKFNKAVSEFHLAADAAKLSLTQMLGKLSDGRCVTHDEAAVYLKFIDAMNTHYQTAVLEAKELLPAEELPKEDSPLDEYVAAYAFRSKNLLKERIEQITAVLEPFIRIQSTKSYYAEALRPYQNQAETVLADLQNPALQIGDLDTPVYQTDAISLFLQCLQLCKDDDDNELAEREALLDKIREQFPGRRIYEGLLSGRYYIANDHIVKHSVHTSDAEMSESTDSEPDHTGNEIADALPESALLNDTEDSPAQEAEPSIDAISDVTPQNETSNDLIDNAQSDQTDDAETEQAWNALGISDPSAVCVTAEDGLLDIQMSEKAALPFGVKTMKKDLKKQSALLILVIKMAAKFGILTADLAATEAPKNWSADVLREGCRIAYELGYLNYNQAADGTAFYSLSPRGKQIFRHQDSAKLFQFKEKDFKDQWRDYDDSNSAAMLRLIYARFMQRYLNEKNSKTSLDFLPYYASHMFGQIFSNYFDNHRSLLVFCVITDTPVGFQELLDILAPQEKDEWAVLMIGASRAQAAAVTKWFHEHVPEFHDKTDMFYMDDSDGTVYTLSGELVPDLHAYFPAEQDITADEQPIELTEDAESDAPAPEDAPDPSDSEEKADDDPEPDALTPAENDGAAEDTAHTETAEQNPPLAEPEIVENLTDAKREKHIELCMKMLASGKQYCATAYAWVLADRYPEMKNFYNQIAYAYYDPLARCQYSSEEIFRIFFTNAKRSPISDYLMLAAVLRNYFYDQWSFDYSIPQLWAAISSNPLLTQNSALQDTIYRLKEFKSIFHHGVDYCADYRQKEQMQMEDSLRIVIADAAIEYERVCSSYTKESVHQERFLKTQEILFDEKGDLAACLEYVKKDDRESLELIEDYLRNSIVRDNCEIAEYNIEQEKLNKLILKAWNDAGKKIRLRKKSSDLMGKLYNNLYKKVEKIAQILCRYAMLLNGCSASDNSTERAEYAQIRKPLQKSIDAAIDFYEQAKSDTLAESCGKQIICDALSELATRIDGSYNEASHRFFYIDFLKSEWVLLDEDVLPVFDEVFEVPELSIMARIERHCSEPDQSFEERMQQILEGGDDYGSARLIELYLKRVAPENPAASMTEQITESEQYVKESIEVQRKEFMEDLELFYAYGMIDNTKVDMKETFVQIMDIWYKKALHDSNYGFFRKILDGIRENIQKKAHSRAESLLRDVDAYITEHADSESKDKIDAVIAKIRERIDAQNYAAAEDLLNRLQKNDLETAESFIEKDHLQDFLSNYQAYSTRAGSAGSSFKSISVHNKDTKGGNRLLDNWPINNNYTADQLKRLLAALGFNVGSVSAQKSIKSNNTFLVSIKQPEDGRKHTYTHPIAAFGSEAEYDGFRVVTIFGKMDANRLIDLMEQIGPSFNTMILLDYSLNLPDRRELARKSKTLHLGKTFIVVDRMVAAYLAWNYADNAVNRMLMALTVPFSAYQPYIYDSAHIMPPEIFMGRKKELEEIMSPKGVHIVYGGRQLGKSALLRKAQADTDHDEHNNRAVLVDIKGKNYREAARKVSNELIDQGILDDGSATDDWEELATLLKRRLRETSKERVIPYLLLLLDEADVFVESQESIVYKPLDALKDVESVGKERFKFVIAGLRNIIRFKNSALDQNKVLTHFSSMTVMPFRAAEARELLEVPLSYLGFRFPNDEKTETLISTIFGTTNYFPGLLQLYCAKLIESLQKNYAGYDESTTPPYVLKEEQIKKALADSTLENQIREKFFITLKLDDDDYYYLIALLAAHHYHNNNGQNGASAKDILELAKFFEITKLEKLSTEEIGALMEEMRELNVFQKTASSRYRFARLNFCQMMGSKEQIDDVIFQYMENGG